MLKKFSNRQLEKLFLHAAGINNVLMEALQAAPQPDEPDEPEDEDMEDELGLGFFACGMNSKDWSELGSRTREQSVETSFNDLEYSQRERDLNRLCGRWASGNTRCGVEISRAGEHFILTCLKRNGSPTDERYILLWLDGDILYYGCQDRMTVLALNTGSDTLMISPGMDYTRVSKDEIK